MNKRCRIWLWIILGLVLHLCSTRKQAKLKRVKRKSEEKPILLGEKAIIFPVVIYDD